MAFEERGKELEQSIRTNVPAGGADSREEKALIDAAKQWGSARAEHLDALLLILREQDGTASSEAWKDRAAKLRSDLDTFSKALGSVSDPAEWARTVVASNVAADDKLVAAVERAVIAAEVRDTMVGYLDTMSDEMEILEAKWSRLEDEHEAFLAVQLQPFEEVEKDVSAKLAEMRDLSVRMKDTILDWVEKSKELYEGMPEGGPDTAGIPFDNEAKVAGLVVQGFRALAAGIETQRMRFERYMREETSSVLFVFGATRDDTKRFIEKYSYRFIEDEEKEASNALGDISSSGGTSNGNRTDADHFVDAARILIRGHSNNAKNAWDAFVLEHEEKFFGPVAPNIEKALFDRAVFEERYERLRPHDLLDLAEMWRNDYRLTWDVDFTGVPVKQTEEFKKQVGQQMRELDELLRDPLLGRFADSMKVVLENTGTMIKDLV